MSAATQHYSVFPAVATPSFAGSVGEHEGRESDVTGSSPANQTPLDLLKAWATSLAVHIAFALGCSAIYLTVESQPELPVLTTIFEDIGDTPLLQDVIQEIDVDSVDPDAPVREAAKSVSETTANPQIQEQQLNPRIRNEMPADPMAVALNDSELTEVLEGVQGDVIQARDDVGSVDRITQEIVNRLREQKVVVAWLMDASESLRTRRSKVIDRFERIYKELDELTEDHEDLLLTSVVAFGEQTVEMTKEPTADRDLIQKAVREIPIDETGVENVFTAIRTTALNHRTLARKGYDVMIVVLTDECGNDFEMLPDAIEQVTRHKMPVFVMGPMAPFGQHEVRVPWTDPQTQQIHRLPVERGPESIRFESPTLPTWNEDLRNVTVSSGFGSYGLAHLSRQSGGIYFLQQDASVSTKGINPEAMLDHSPDYVSTTEYTQLVKKSPLREAVLAVTEASRKASWTQPTTKFLASAIQFDIRDDQESLLKISQFLDQAIEELRDVEDTRDTEPSPRWRAHYDLLMGRLLANRARLNNTLPLLNEMFKKPKVCKDGTTNAWELTGGENATLRDSEFVENNAPDDTGGGKAASQSAPIGNDDAHLAQTYLQRVEAEHPGTPWCLLAQLELDSAVEFEWKEAFLMPPEGEKLPWDKKPWNELSDKQKKARKKFERFQLEKKKRQAEQAEQAKAAEAEEAKPSKIPKL